MNPRPRSTSSRHAATSFAIADSAKSSRVTSSALRPAVRAAATAASNAARCRSVKVKVYASGLAKSFGRQAPRPRTGRRVMTALIDASPALHARRSFATPHARAAEAALPARNDLLVEDVIRHFAAERAQHRLRGPPDAGT